MSSKVLNPPSMAPSPVLKKILFREKPKPAASLLPWRPAESISNCFELFGEIEFTDRPQMPAIGATVEDKDDGGADAMRMSSEDDGSSKNSGPEEMEVQEQGRGCSARGSGARGGAFPPTISTIGGDGKPWLYLKPRRTDGRFVLQVAVVPSHKCLQATREHGRLLLHLSNSPVKDAETELDG